MNMYFEKFSRSEIKVPNPNTPKEIKIASETTKSGLLKNRFIYDFMSSMRQKVNDPLGQRAKKRKEANQR